MKVAKKVLLCVVCLCLILGVVGCACGSGTENGNPKDEGSNVVDDLGNAVEDGVQDVEDGIDEMTDDRADVNDATEGTVNP